MSLALKRQFFRNGIAYTTVRNERYSFFSEIEEMFRVKVAADDQDSCHPILKAARLYLDIIFFHPFPDGNARAAVLWYSYYCLKHGYPLPNFSMYFGFDFIAGDIRSYWRFCVLAIKELFSCDK